MYDIYKLIKRTLKQYSELILEKKIQQMKDVEENILTICYIINTAEYCKETLPSMEEILKQCLD